MAERKRKSTSTPSFGVSGRESHEASGFYSRFEPPALLTDETVNACAVADHILVGDSRKMTEVADNSVALVVTSPPYFAGRAPSFVTSATTCSSGWDLHCTVRPTLTASVSSSIRWPPVHPGR